MASDETRLVLVRHGESRAQAEGFLSGHDTCTGLSEHGRAQAAALRDRLVETNELGNVSAVFTSVLQRAVETAEIIGAGLGEIRPKQDCDWCEIHAGEAEGLTWAEFRERYNTETWLENPFQRRMPGSETWAEFYARSGARLRRVGTEHAGDEVVVVCHGGIIGASFVALADMGMRQAARLMAECTNTSLTEWRYRGGEWRLVKYNDAAHLAGREFGA
jgi:probable phosphoglycerate mutase